MKHSPKCAVRAFCARSQRARYALRRRLHAGTGSCAAACARRNSKLRAAPHTAAPGISAPQYVRPARVTPRGVWRSLTAPNFTHRRSTATLQVPSRGTRGVPLARAPPRPQPALAGAPSRGGAASNAPADNACCCAACLRTRTLHNRAHGAARLCAPCDGENAPDQRWP